MVTILPITKTTISFALPMVQPVALTHCESNSALQDTVQGTTFSLIIVDEASEGPELPVIDALALTLRAPDVPLRLCLAGNPGGANHSALAERYVTGRTLWQPFTFADQQWVYAPSTVDDNPHLPDAYKRNFSVLAHTDPALYIRWVRLSLHRLTLHRPAVCVLMVLYFLYRHTRTSIKRSGQSMVETVLQP